MISIILFIISIIILCFSIYKIKTVSIIDKNIEKQNQELLKEYNNYKEESDKLLNINNQLNNKIESSRIELDNIQQKTILEKEHLKDLQDNALSSLEKQKRISEKAFENYFEVLENKYKETEKEYDMNTDALKTAYSNLQLQLMRESDEYRDELEKIKNTLAAAQQAQIRKEEIKNNLSFYCIELSDEDKADISQLEKVKKILHKPRIMSMLIWQTYFQKPLKTLSNKIIGVADKTGIYKITNILTNECYIGQAVNYRPMKNFSQRLLGVA